MAKRGKKMMKGMHRMPNGKMMKDSAMKKGTPKGMSKSKRGGGKKMSKAMRMKMLRNMSKMKK